MTDKVECIVVGAGVIGVAVARALALSGREVLVLEAQDAVGTQVSARSSEVVHAGIYYPKTSKKAELCVRGRRMLYRFCEERNVPHLKTGKLVVATAPDEIAKLHDLHALGAANGVAGLQFLSPGELRQKEPGINGTGALFSPETGIVDSHAFILAMQAEAESKGAIFVLKTPFRSERAVGHSFTVQAGLGSEAAELSSRVLINAAGLNAQSVASRVRRMPEQLIPKRYLSRGAYFAFNGSPPFQHLVYPVPDAEGLSVHFTLDMGGQGKFGPDHEWVEKPDFIVDPARASAIAEAVRRYYPDLEESLLTPAYAGIRPKIQGPGEAPKDFNIQGREVHGITGLVNLFGIESPGLTAALAIADTVAHMVKT